MANTSRRARWLFVLVVALVVAAAGAALLLVRPSLVDAQDRADARWVPLRAPLAARYEALGVVADTLKLAGAADRSVTKDLDAALARWNRLVLRGAEHTDVVVETTTANELEALARRVRANVANSARLAPNEALAAAIAVYDQTIPTLPSVDAYNRAVRRYVDEREATFQRLVARVLGFESRPQLAFGP